MSTQPLLSPALYKVFSEIGQHGDREIDLAYAALYLSSLCYLDLSLDSFFSHLNTLSRDLGEVHKHALHGSVSDSVALRMESLASVMHDMHEYGGGDVFRDGVQGVSLTSAIQKRRGPDIALGILALHCADAQGWEICGLAFSGRFLCRLSYEGERLIFDPFDGFKVLESQDLRSLVKECLGEGAELSASYFEPIGNRDVLIRFHNMMKFCQIENEEYEEAFLNVAAMELIAPDEYKLLLESGVLLARLGHTQAAIKRLESYCEKAPTRFERDEADLLLRDLRLMLN